MTDTHTTLLSQEFKALSASLGRNPLRVQGAGGNTSIKDDHTMWIKASGTELAEAVTRDIFVAVDRSAALAEAMGQTGDGSCKGTVIDPKNALRPSIETTFHAALDWTVVAHTHSVATLAHVISPEGRLRADQKLQGLPFVQVPYAKPGLRLTQEILKRVQANTQIILLQNHGLICCGATVQEVRALMDEVEQRLDLKPNAPSYTPDQEAPEGYRWAHESWLALYAEDRILGGTYYPDHTVFLGPALPTKPSPDWPAYVVEGVGIALRETATPSQKAMLRCLGDVLARVPSEWTLEPIGAKAEQELLNWDAEKYRQALAEAS